MYELVYRVLLRRLPAETAHAAGFWLIRAASTLPGVARLLRRWLTPRDPVLRVRALGLDLPGPLGLAAGFDKDARGADALGALGFAFVEVGTVTARAQPGNPRPRMFRLPADRAVVNRMGFNNAGAAAAAAHLRRRQARWARRARRGRHPVVVGVNIGKTKAAPPDAAIADYVTSARLVAGVADYVVVNVSSPNTPGLRDLQAVSSLRPLLAAVREALDAAVREEPGTAAVREEPGAPAREEPGAPARKERGAPAPTESGTPARKERGAPARTESGTPARTEPGTPARTEPGTPARTEPGTGARGNRVPLLVKIAPDLADSDIDAIADLAVELGLDGIIATNTTIARPGLTSDPAQVGAAGAGGLSGAPLRPRALEVLRRLHARAGDRLVLVAAGGIETADDAWERIAAGATLVQAYTGFIYGGPGWPRRVQDGLARRARAAGLTSISQVRGTEAAPRT
jgi:dihydroorotate dehydrogenase